MKYAIIKSGSSQIQVAEGDVIKVLGYTKKPEFEVLFFHDGKEIFTDKTKLAQVKIKAEVLNTGKSRKLMVGRFKSKSRYDKQRGFREQFTNVKIAKFGFSISEKEEKVAPKTTTKTKAKVKPTPVKKTIKKEVKVTGKVVKKTAK